MSTFQLCGQSFSKVTIRDISNMRNNYGNAVADYDLDGDLDIFIVAYDPFLPNQPRTWSRLFNNRGLGRMEDVTLEANLGAQFFTGSNKDHKLGASWGDYNNDRYPDLLLTHAGGLELWYNNGDGTFKEISKDVGLFTCQECINSSGLWWDFDLDGDLDLYISNYNGPNQLFENDGTGLLIDQSEVYKLNDSGGTWTSVVFDVNGDKWLDLYVINDYGLSRLYINEGGRSFVESTAEYGLRNTGNGMGPAIGDYNNDGSLDLYVTNIADLQPNVLFSKNSDGLYQDVSSTLNVHNADWGWGSIFFDADHDGDEDLYAVNGFNDLNYTNRFFKNMHTEGSEQFVDWSDQSSADGNANGMAVQAFDYDEDGDVDILVSNTNDQPYIFRNNGAGGNWLKVSLEGSISNRNALGALVKIVAGELELYRYNYCVGIMSQSLIPLHFGLASNLVVDSLIIHWPEGGVEVFEDISVNQKLHIVEKQQILTSTQEPHESRSNSCTLRVTRVSPNPFEYEVVIFAESKLRENVRCRIYSSEGELMFQDIIKVSGDNTVQFTWNCLSGNPGACMSGLYYYRLDSSTDFLVGKVIKI